MFDNMNFCNGCGAPSGHDANPPDRRAGRLFIIGGTFIGLIGLMTFFAVVRTLVTSPLDPATKAILIVTYLASVIIMFSVMVTLGWKQINRPASPRKKSDEVAEYQRPTSFQDVSTSQLPVGDMDIGSVTDSTTRTLDEVVVRRS